MTIDLSMPDEFGDGLPQFQGGTARDAASFQERLDAWKLHVTQAGALLTKRVAAETFTALVMPSPVGNPSRWKRPRRGYVGGHFRRNWQLSVGGEALELPGVDPAGTLATAAAYAAIAALQPGQSFTIVNPTAYSERLAQGWSPQAAAGWVEAACFRVWDKYTRVA